MSDGPEQTSAGLIGVGGTPIRRKILGFSLPESVISAVTERTDRFITGITPPAFRESLTSDSVPSIPNANGVALTADQISNLTPQQREEYFVRQGLLPDLQTRIGQGQSRTPTREELEENLTLSSLLDRRTTLLQNQTDLRNIGENRFANAVQAELESIDRQIAALGNSNLPLDSNTTGAAAASVPNFGSSNQPNSPITSQPNTSSGPYLYAPIDPLDDRYDFKTGQKIRNKCGSSTSASQTPTGNSPQQESAAQATSAAISGTEPLTVPSAPTNNQSLPRPNYDPRGDQIAVNSPSAVRARLDGAQRRLAEARNVANSTGYPGAVTYVGQEADINLILNRGYIDNAK